MKYTTLAILSMINFLDYADSAAVATLAPNIQRTFGISEGAFTSLAGVVGGVFVAAAVPLGVLADRGNRIRILGSSAAVASVATIGSGFSPGFGSFIGARLVDGAGQASILPVHSSVLIDQYPSSMRSRVLGVHALGSPLAYLITPTLAAGITSVATGNEAWRWTFYLLGAVSLVFSLIALTLPEPARTGITLDPKNPQIPRISLSAASTRLLAIPTARYLYASVAVLGFVIVGTPVVLSQFLDQTFHLSVFHRGLALSLVEIGSLLGVISGGIIGDRLLSKSPSRLPLFAGGSTAIFAVLFTAGLRLPSLWQVVVVVALAKSLSAMASVPLYTVLATVAPPALRSTAFALLGLAIFLGGGVAGGFIIGALTDAHGARFALTATVLPACLVAATIMSLATRVIGSDLRRAEDEERTESLRVPNSTERPSALAVEVRGMNVSIGARQILFDVDLSLAPGEALALVGTNGAGKSTILRAISGLSGISSGTIRVDGVDLSYADVNARVAHGVVHVPSGAALFDSMTVAQNLLVGAHTYAWDAARIHHVSEQVLSLFPALRTKMSQSAGSLSGGEQQMLALAKALMLEPRILLIDELSLGLAPVVVAELIAVVESLRARGVSLIIVEQSINVALAIADRAIFLEQGRIRFEGSTQELLDHDELLRSIFLGPTLTGATR